MSVSSFKEKVVNGKGYNLSEGTLNIEDLLSESFDLLVRYNISNEKLKKDIVSVFTFIEQISEGGSLNNEVYHGNAEIKSGDLDDANFIWNEKVVDYFNDIAPEGYFFGASEGNSSLIGWFKIDEELLNNY